MCGSVVDITCGSVGYVYVGERGLVQAKEVLMEVSTFTHNFLLLVWDGVFSMEQSVKKVVEGQD